jgi:hypothetical protein
LLQLPVFATIRPVFTHEPRRGSRQFHFAGQCQRKRERKGRRDGITATTLFLKRYLPTRLENWRPGQSDPGASRAGVARCAVAERFM